jgi:hypothetical protein
MPVISVQVTPDGFHVPRELACQLGLRPGDEARLEIRRALDAGDVRRLALAYAWRRLGDAVGVEEPEWDGETWGVALKVRGRPDLSGRLFLTPEGDVLTDRSTTRAELLEMADVERSREPAA